MLIYKALLLESWSATILNTSSNTNGNLSLSLSRSSWAPLEIPLRRFLSWFWFNNEASFSASSATFSRFSPSNRYMHNGETANASIMKQ